MKKVELSLKYMNKLKGEDQSVDIYFDNLAHEFVVKVTNILNNTESSHFRNEKLKRAIKDASKFLLEKSEQ